MPKNSYELKKQPLQERSKFTVEVIKEAAAHILRDQGIQQFTTNRVAEKAGVSIGSLYQYFPSKESLIAEVKRDHFNDLRESFKSAYEKSKDCSLPVITRCLIKASIDAHKLDPVLHQVLSGDLSEFTVREDDSPGDSIRSIVENLLEKHTSELRNNIDIPLASRITCTIIEKIIHDAIVQDPDLPNEHAIIDELYLLVTTYLTIPGPDASNMRMMKNTFCNVSR